MAVQRRNIFGAKYGTTKIEHGKPRAPKIPAQTLPPMRLGIEAQQQLPPELGGAPQQGQTFAQGPPQPAQGQAQGAGTTPLDPNMEKLLQQLLSQFGGQRG